MIWDVRELTKNNQEKDLGKIDLPFMPGIFSNYEKIKKEKPPAKPNNKKIMEYCEQEGISIDEYKEMEKREKEKAEYINMLSRGILKIKKNKYKIVNIDISKKNNIKRINVVKIGG